MLLTTNSMQPSGNSFRIIPNPCFRETKEDASIPEDNNVFIAIQVRLPEAVPSADQTDMTGTWHRIRQWDLRVLWELLDWEVLGLLSCRRKHMNTFILLYPFYHNQVNTHKTLLSQSLYIRSASKIPSINVYWVIIWGIELQLLNLLVSVVWRYLLKTAHNFC